MFLSATPKRYFSTLAICRMLLVLLLGCIGLSQSTTPNPVLTPSVVTTYIGGSITLTCTKPDLNMVTGWFTDLIPLIFRLENKYNITFESDINDISYNNSDVYCVGRYPSDPTKLYYSNPSTIILQGYLTTVHPSINQSDPCTLLIYWDPPFTLPGVPILGYNINITSTVTNEINKTFVTETQVHIPLGYYTVSIAGVNPVGEGNISIIHVDPTQYSTDFNISDNVTVSRNGSEWTVQVIVENNMLCGQNMKDSLSMNIINQKDTTDVYITSDIITQSCTVSNSTLLSGTLSLPEDNHYWINVAMDIGNYIRVSGNSPLSTFDVQDIIVLNSINGGLCMNITYIIGSIADSCHIKLNCSDYRDLIINYDIIGTVGCLNNIPIDEETSCILKGYDQVNGMSEDQNEPAVVMDDVIISKFTIPTMIATLISITSTLDPTILLTFLVSLFVVLGVITLTLAIIIVLCSIIIYIARSKKQSLTLKF